MSSLGYVILLIVVNIIAWVVLSMIPHFKNRNKIYIVLSFITLWVFLSIREPTSDMIGYQQYFQSLDVNHFEMVLENRWEILFKVFLYGIKLITDNPQIMMSIISFVTLIGPFLFIKRYSKSYLLSIIMFITIGTFHMQFYILRQAIALSIFLTFFYLISEKKLVKYFLAIIVAALFHKTALILLLLYPLINVPSSKYKKIAIICGAAIFSLFSPYISTMLMSDFYSEYADAVFSGAGIGLFLFYLFLYAVYFILRRRSQLREESVIVGTSLFTIFIQFFTMQNNAFSRIAAYTRNSFCVLIPNLTQDLSRKNRVVFSLFIIIMCICFIAITGAFEDYNVAKF